MLGAHLSYNRFRGSVSVLWGHSVGTGGISVLRLLAGARPPPPPLLFS